MPNLATGERHNLWSEHAAELAEVYTRAASSVRFSLVTRALLSELGERSHSVCDIGGGHGQQALLLARRGHKVTVVDADPAMLALAQRTIDTEDSSVRRSVTLVHADGQDPQLLASETFDAVLCHSVLMYEQNPAPMLRTVARLTGDGGLVSVLSVNPESAAMRPGLQGRWRDIVLILRGLDPCTDSYPTSNHSRERVTNLLRENGVSVQKWYGVGIFTDHLTEPVRAADPADVFEAEWQAGLRDPYRGVARCYHLLGRRERLTIGLTTP